MSDEQTTAAPAVASSFLFCPCAACGAAPAPEPSLVCWWCGAEINISMKNEIIKRQANYARLMGNEWTQDQLSDMGWLCLVAVPWLLHEVENNRKDNGSDGDANGNPGADGIWPAKSSL